MFKFRVLVSDDELDVTMEYDVYALTPEKARTKGEQMFLDDFPDSTVPYAYNVEPV